MRCVGEKISVYMFDVRLFMFLSPHTEEEEVKKNEIGHVSNWLTVNFCECVFVSFVCIYMHIHHSLINPRAFSGKTAKHVFDVVAMSKRCTLPNHIVCAYIDVCVFS